MIKSVKEYLVGQTWQCVERVQCAEMAPRLYVVRGNQMSQERIGLVQRPGVKSLQT